MNIPLRTSFMRTITPQAASPNDTNSQVSKKQRSARESRNKAQALMFSKNLDPSESNRNAALLAPGCGRAFCQKCSFQYTLT
jgi:hypothetical protein